MRALSASHPSRSSWRLATAGLPLVLVVLAACGSSSDNGSGAPSSGGASSTGGGAAGGGTTAGNGSVSGAGAATVAGGAGTAGGPVSSGGSPGNGGAAGAAGSGGASGTPGGAAVFAKNVKVNDDMSSGMHTEVSLASGPNGLLVAGWMDFRDARTCAYSVSTDGGETWGENVFIRVSQGGMVGDPAVAIDADERIYAVCQDYGVSQIRIMTSTDAGATWGAPRSIQSAPDKPWIAGSPMIGGVAFVSWLGGAAGIKRTTDGGMNWGPVQRLEFLNHGTTISVGTSGLVHVAYTPNGGPLRYVRSKDLGESWETAKTIAQTGTFCWSDCTGPRQHPIVGGGSDPTGKYVVASWPANRAGGQGDEDIWLVYSSDGGDTWTEPVRVNDNENESRQLQPWAAVDAYGRVHVAWTDARNGQNETWYARSADPSKGFEKNVQVTDERGPLGAGFRGDYKGIAISGNDVVVVWDDTRNDGSNIYSARAIGAAGP